MKAAAEKTYLRRAEDVVRKNLAAIDAGTEAPAFRGDPGELGGCPGSSADRAERPGRRHGDPGTADGAEG